MEPPSSLTFDRNTWSFDCEPTLNDSQVLEFCREGFVLLPGVVPDEVNQKTCEYLEGRLPAQPSWTPRGWTEQDIERVRASHEPSAIFLEEWYIEHVLLNKSSGCVKSWSEKHSSPYLDCPASIAPYPEWNAHPPAGKPLRTQTCAYDNSRLCRCRS